VRVVRKIVTEEESTCVHVGKWGRRGIALCFLNPGMRCRWRCGQLCSPATLSRERDRVDTNNDLDAWEKRKLHCIARNRSTFLLTVFCWRRKALLNLQCLDIMYNYEAIHCERLTKLSLVVYTQSGVEPDVLAYGKHDNSPLDEAEL